jgi:hypothetical protein
VSSPDFCIPGVDATNRYTQTLCASTGDRVDLMGVCIGSTQLVGGGGLHRASAKNMVDKDDALVSSSHYVIHVGLYTVPQYCTSSGIVGA